MSLLRRHFLQLAGAGIVYPAVYSSSLAQTYPTHPVRLIVPSAPGGVHDVIARIWAEQLKSTLGIIVIENRGGAGGTLGITEAARTQADGYTLLLGSNSTHILLPLLSKQPFDPIKDFELISIFAITSTAIAVHPAASPQTLQQLIEAARTSPGKLSYAHSGLGSISNVSGEMFKQLAGGLDILPVPYRGMGPAQTDVISGNVTMFVPNITSQVIGLHQGGKIRILSVNAPRRHSALPDIPTSIEAGVPGMITQNFFGILAPAGTPKEILTRVNDLTQTALGNPEFQQRLDTGGFEPMPGVGPDQAPAFMQGEYVRWQRVIQSAGIKLD